MDVEYELVVVGVKVAVCDWVVLVDCDKEVLIDTVNECDGELDAVPVVLGLTDGVNETLVDTVLLIDNVELLVALSDEDDDIVTDPLVLIE